MKSFNKQSSVNVLVNNKYVHIYWNNFLPPHKNYSVNFRHYKQYARPFHFWINYGKGALSFAFGKSQ